MTTENNVAAQAGDEPIRAVFEAWARTDRYMFVPPSRMSGGRYVHPGMQGDWEVWQAAQVSPRATADVERDAAHFGLFLQMLDKAHVKFSKGKDNAINRVDFTIMVGNETTDTFRGKVRDLFDQLAAIATTKPGA